MLPTLASLAALALRDGSEAAVRGAAFGAAEVGGGVAALLGNNQ